MLTDISSGDKAVIAVNQLTALIESRNWSEVPGNARLLATLLSSLSTLLAKRQSIKEGIDYLEQEILGAALAVLEKISDPLEIQRAHVGIEVIIKVIRASTNPRTSQRALLVASELARLIPEAVLHNAMPIFTFMGASELQRDDAYSFGVVEKVSHDTMARMAKPDPQTVERIVPVMTRSLRAKAKSKLALYQGEQRLSSSYGVCLTVQTPRLSSASLPTWHPGYPNIEHCRSLSISSNLWVPKTSLPRCQCCWSIDRLPKLDEGAEALVKSWSCHRVSP